MRVAAVVGLLLCSALRPTAVGAQEDHRLPLTPENIHWGYYDASIPPALTIRSGDRVHFENMLARGLERLRVAGFDEARFTEAMLEVERAETVRVGSHPLNGPISVEGAEPGDVLEVRILEIGFLTPYGVSGFLPGGGTLPDDFPSAALRRFEVDTISGTITMQGVP
ncbi:MAG: acetamidase/formamidase family protein, partial [Gemmatimonadota bacterium]|nr:acetamidase/formamidase family protein [Gemmatimonadota bacterium]